MLGLWWCFERLPGRIPGIPGIVVLGMGVGWALLLLGLLLEFVMDPLRGRAVAYSPSQVSWGARAVVAVGLGLVTAALLFGLLELVVRW